MTGQAVQIGMYRTLAYVHGITNFSRCRVQIGFQITLLDGSFTRYSQIETLNNVIEVIIKTLS